MQKQTKHAPVPESPAAIGLATGLGVPHDPLACGHGRPMARTVQQDLTAFVPGQSGAEGLAPLPEADPEGSADHS